MNRLLLLAIPLALAACSSEQAPQESAEDFASRIGQDGEPTAGAGVDPDKPNTVPPMPISRNCRSSAISAVSISDRATAGAR